MSVTVSDLWLERIPVSLRADAVRALQAGNARGFLGMASNDFGLDLVLGNMHALMAAGLYESALLRAFISTRVNNSHCSANMLRWLFEEADRERLVAAGDPMPDGDEFTLYRGVAGRGPARRVRGLSWTTSLERAAWFARRFPQLHDPVVYSVTVDRADVYAYVNDRHEEEFLVSLTNRSRVTRLRVDVPALARQCIARDQALSEKRWAALKAKFELAKRELAGRGN